MAEETRPTKQPARLCGSHDIYTRLLLVEMRWGELSELPPKEIATAAARQVLRRRSQSHAKATFTSATASHHGQLSFIHLPRKRCDAAMLRCFLLFSFYAPMP